MVIKVIKKRVKHESLKLIKKFNSIAIGETTSGVIGSVFWLYLASVLTVSNYGEIQFFIGIATFGVGLSLLAQSNTIIVYEVKKRGLTGILFLISFIIAGIVSIVLFTIYSRLDIVFLTFGVICAEMGMGYLMGKKLFVRYSIFLISQKILMCLLTVGLYFFIGIDGILYGITISYIPVAILVLSTLKNTTLNLPLLKNNFSFIFYNYAERLIVFSRRNLDKIIIMPILGFEILGEFALGFQIYSIMIIFASISFKLLLLNDTESKSSKRMSIVILSISIIISILGITIAPSIVPTIFPQFTSVIEIIPIMSLAVIPNTIMLIFSSKFIGNEKSSFILIGTIIHAVTYLSLIVFLGPTYGIIGLSISFLVSSIGYAAYLVIMYKIQKPIIKK
jgi:O-antigen/teichoic acid export membrane protein